MLCYFLCLHQQIALPYAEEVNNLLFQCISGTVSNGASNTIYLLVPIAVTSTVLRYILAFLPRYPVIISTHAMANPELSFAVIVGDVNRTVMSDCISDNVKQFKLECYELRNNDNHCTHNCCQ